MFIKRQTIPQTKRMKHLALLLIKGSRAPVLEIPNTCSAHMSWQLPILHFFRTGQENNLSKSYLWC